MIAIPTETHPSPRRADFVRRAQIGGWNPPYGGHHHIGGWNPSCDNAGGNRHDGTGVGGWLHLAATPVFGAMALVTAVTSDDPAHLLCSAMGHGGWAPGGMPVMYLLMAIFHAGPWWKWAALRVARGGMGVRHPGAGRGPS